MGKAMAIQVPHITLPMVHIRQHYLWLWRATGSWAIVYAISTSRQDSVHAYSDAQGNYLVPGLIPDHIIFILNHLMEM